MKKSWSLVQYTTATVTSCSTSWLSQEGTVQQKPCAAVSPTDLGRGITSKTYLWTLNSVSACFLGAYACDVNVVSSWPPVTCPVWRDTLARLCRNVAFWSSLYFDHSCGHHWSGPGEGGNERRVPCDLAHCTPVLKPFAAKAIFVCGEARHLRKTT